jgi:hypothetical protein
LTVKPAPNQGNFMRSNTVITGTHFITGDDACAEGGIAAGCTFFAGYPITPATEVAERMSKRLPQVGGVYVQMEDELASMVALKNRKIYAKSPVLPQINNQCSLFYAIQARNTYFSLSRILTDRFLISSIIFSNFLEF